MTNYASSNKFTKKTAIINCRALSPVMNGGFIFFQKGKKFKSKLPKENISRLKFPLCYTKGVNNKTSNTPLYSYITKNNKQKCKFCNRGLCAYLI